MFYEIGKNYEGKLTNYLPYATALQRKVWDCLDSIWIESTIEAGRSFKSFTFTPLPATMFLDFTRIGNRSNYEDIFFKKRRALNALVLAECASNSGEFMDAIINGIFSICEESAWQLPAHNSYIRDTPCLPLPDATDPVLDLFSCETGALLATIHYLLEEKLDTISPFITKRIRYELQHRIYTPYLSKHFWWMGNGDEPMCNWTIWCTQNILLSVFLLPNDPDFMNEVFLKACKSVDYFLKDYGDDGCCDEGAQYYRHSGLCLFNTIEILNGITNNFFIDVYQEKKVENIATYIMNVHIHDKYYTNFADCSPVAGRAGVREFLFAKRINNPAMMQFASQDFHAANDLLLANEINLYYRLQNAFTITEINNYQTDEELFHPDIYYSSVGLFIARDSKYCLAVKAGDNGDSHNHNDTGSFTIYKEGYPFIIDVGVETYCQKTFSPRRYEIWTMQSAFHNLPTINGIMQEPGTGYLATNVDVSLEEDDCHIRMDIASAYPKEAGIKSYQRLVTFNKGTSITIDDSFKLDSNKDGQVVISLMTYEKPQVISCDKSADCMSKTMIQIGDLGTISILTEISLTIEEIEITDARLKTAWDHEIYRILITPKESSFQLLIKE